MLLNRKLVITEEVDFLKDVESLVNILFKLGMIGLKFGDVKFGDVSFTVELTTTWQFEITDTRFKELRKRVNLCLNSAKEKKVVEIEAKPKDSSKGAA